MHTRSPAHIPTARDVALRVIGILERTGTPEQREDCAALRSVLAGAVLPSEQRQAANFARAEPPPPTGT